MTKAWPHGDPGDVVRAIVSDQHFALRKVTPRTQPSWLDTLSAWLGNALQGVLHGIDRALGSKNGIGTQIGFIVILLAFGFLAFGVYALVGSFARRENVRQRADVTSLAAVEQTSLALRAAACAAAQARRYRDAAALLFLAAGRALDERGRLRYDPARTPGEYRRLLRDPQFDALAGDAVIALFAAAEPRDDLFERMNTTYDRFFGATEL